MNDIAFIPAPQELPGTCIKVVGVGGAGCNAINRMIETGVQGVEFIAMNTDQQHLSLAKAPIKLLLGPESRRGRGTGGKPELGLDAAEESRDAILDLVKGADMVFITAGLGGGTGTGAAPVVANCAREAGALTVAVVVTPFAWESAKRNKAMQGLDDLRNVADTVIVVSNQRLTQFSAEALNWRDAYGIVDGVLIQGVRGVTDLILRPGDLNGDFADVEAVLRNGNEALIGTGQSEGDNALQDAIEAAMQCPLLERMGTGPATQVLVSVMTDWQRIQYTAMETAMNYLHDRYEGQAEIKLCQAHVPELEDKVLVTILASGFDQEGVGDLQPATPPQMDLPVQLNPNRIYGNVPPLSSEARSATPTRLLTPAPTPSDEVGGLHEALEVPAILRMKQGQLPIE